MIFDGDRDYIGPYLRYLADNVGLRDWHIHFAYDPSPDGTDGQCNLAYGRRRAEISFKKEWMKEDESEFRDTCLLELIHCHTEQIIQPLQDIEDVLGKVMHAPLYNATVNGLEHCIDAIAYDWGRHLPLPSEWLELATEPEGEA